MTTYKNSLAGLTSGTTITPGNSGGDSGQAFDTVVGSVVAQSAADITDAHDLGARATLSATNDAYAAWTVPAATSGFVRLYVRVPTVPPPATLRLAKGMDGSSTRWELRVVTNGYLAFTNSVGDWIEQSGAPLVAGTIYRVELDYTTGAPRLHYYLGESTTPQAKQSNATTSTVAQVTQVRFGAMTSSAQSLNVDTAGHGWSDTGLLGPEPAAASPVAYLRTAGGDVPLSGVVMSDTPAPSAPVQASTYDTGLPRQVFSPDTFWYRPLPDTTPLDPQSAQRVAFLIDRGIAGWGSAAKGYPSWAVNYQANTPSILVIQPGEPTEPVALRNPPGGPYGANLAAMFSDFRVPTRATIASTGTDRFLNVYDPATDTYWEGWVVERDAAGYPGWSAARGQRIQQASTKLGRAEPYGSSAPYFYYGSNAAGLAQEPGIIKAQELQEGHITHALSIAVPVACVAARDVPTANAGISQPAVRSDGQSAETYAIKMGQRLRLPASLNLDALDLHPVCRAIARAFQEYGCFIVDRAGDCSMGGENRADLPNGVAVWDALMAGAQPHNVCWDAPKPGGGTYQPFPWSSLQLLEFETTLDGLP